MCFVLLLKKVSLIAFARAMAMAFVKSSMIQKLCKKASLFRPKPKYLTNNHMTILLLHFFHLFLRQKNSHLESPKAKIISQSQQSFTFFILLHIFHSLSTLTSSFSCTVHQIKPKCEFELHHLKQNRQTDQHITYRFISVDKIYERIACAKNGVR